RHRIFIMQGGYASIARDPRRMVHGVLWDLALSDVRALDAYEDVAGGLYAKTQQPILRASGGSARALVYIGRSGAGDAPRAGYMEHVTAVARAWGLPDAYLRELAALTPGASKPGATVSWTAPDGSMQGAPAARAQPLRLKVRPRFATPFDRR
ncbi:MAG TPA: gamma-glutamylcyclotransferase, partial [Beijerinckiaceae bacterium]